VVRAWWLLALFALACFAVGFAQQRERMREARYSAAGSWAAENELERLSQP
jgi:hypothetical protein